MNPSKSTVASVGLGVPVAVILSWCAREFGGIEMPSEVEVAFGVIVSALIGYFFTGGQQKDVESGHGKTDSN